LAPVAQPQETKPIKETKMIYVVFVVAVLTRFLMNSHLPGFFSRLWRAAVQRCAPEKT